MFQAASLLNLEAELSRLCRRVGLEAGSRLGDSRCFFLNTHPSEMEDLGVLQLSLRDLRERFPQLPVTLEVHEATVTNSRVMQELKATLDDLEYRLAYDDFGAGQSRLAELMDVPPDFLKFDLSLTRDIDRAPERRQRTLANLVRMSAELGIQPLAEGVETASEAHMCLELGFALCQGFFYGEPVPVEELLSSTSPRTEV
jgi:EAL domain-containing protein (putative c-di-GMP-specific phosphodiesterase class I)